MKGRYSLVFICAMAPIFCYSNASAQLSSPQDVKAEALSARRIVLTWVDTNQGGARYSIERSLSQTGDFVAIHKTKKNVVRFTNRRLARGTTYYYRIRAVRSLGSTKAFSEYSSIASATTPINDKRPPSVPTGLAASAASCSQINLSWTASKDTGGSGLKGYNVHRNGIYLKQVTTSSTSDTGLSALTSYSYTVLAVDNAGNQSGQCTAASATTPACADTVAPSVPAGLTASAASCSQINLSWTASTDTGGSGLKGYNVYRNGIYLKQVDRKCVG